MDKNLADTAALTDYIDELLNLRPDLNLSSAQLPNVRLGLLKELNNAINSHLITLLSDEEAAEFDSFLEKKASDDELNDFLEKKIPNIATEIALVLMNFKKDFLAASYKEIGVASDATGVASDATGAGSGSSAPADSSSSSDTV